MSDFFTLRDDYYEDFRQKYGDGDYTMGLAEDAARVDHQTMLAAEEYRRGPSPPLTYEEQKVLSMPIRAPAQQGAQRNQTMASIIPIGASLLELGLGIGAILLSAYLMDKLQPEEEEAQVQKRSHLDELTGEVELLEQEIELLEQKIAYLKARI